MQRGYRYAGRHLSVSVERPPEGRTHATIDGLSHEFDATWIDSTTLHLTVDGVTHTVHVARIGEVRYVAVRGVVYALTPDSGSDSSGQVALLASPQVVAPMPGKVLQVLVAAGQEVAAGDGLLILEAMKMEHRVVAEAAAVVRAVHVGDGEMVDAGVVLIELEFREPSGR
jgi:biotin carboxyl carrier protein